MNDSHNKHHVLVDVRPFHKEPCFSVGALACQSPRGLKMKKVHKVCNLCSQRNETDGPNSTLAAFCESGQIGISQQVELVICQIVAGKNAMPLQT
jgi:hypothetical protein